jgi:hypothetical protein
MLFVFFVDLHSAASAASTASSAGHESLVDVQRGFVHHFQFVRPVLLSASASFTFAATASTSTSGRSQRIFGRRDLVGRLQSFVVVLSVQLLPTQRGRSTPSGAPSLADAPLATGRRQKSRRNLI